MGSAKWLGLAAMGLLVGIVGCGASSGDELSEQGDEVSDVASTSQALGNIASRWSVPNQTPLGSSPTHVVFANRTEACAVNVVSVHLETGGSVTMPFSAFDCRNPTGAVVDGEVFIQDAASNDILRYTTIAEGVRGWVKVTDTTGAARGLGLNSLYVMWADNAGMFRMRRTGGVREDLNPAAGARILAQDGATLYYTLSSPSGTELRSMQTNGTGDRFLRTSATPITQLGFDATYVYWPDNASSPRRLLRLHKVERVLSTITSSTERYFYTPQSTGSHVYFVSLKGSQSEMIRRNLSNGNTVIAAFPQPFASHYLRIGADEVYTAGVMFGFGPPYGIVHRGDL